ncbi:MAG TPA: ATP-dependent Clp protease adaptor ClpS [Bacteroidia bacterium]|nr:ATP-dependent Clp protease adaptor ClpS [Bacteroidia bacterium]
MGNQQKTIQESEVLLDEKVKNENHLVLYNDEVNTFDFVIDSLVEICKHDRLQAEQCTYLVHYRGKCSVKDGPVKKLKPLCEAFHDRGLTASIE